MKKRRRTLTRSLLQKSSVGAVGGEATDVAAARVGVRGGESLLRGRARERVAGAEEIPRLLPRALPSALPRVGAKATETRWLQQRKRRRQKQLRPPTKRMLQRRSWLPLKRLLSQSLQRAQRPLGQRPRARQKPRRNQAPKKEEPESQSQKREARAAQ